MLSLDEVSVSGYYILNFDNKNRSVFLETILVEEDMYIYYFSITQPERSEKEIVIADSLDYGSEWYLT